MCAKIFVNRKDLYIYLIVLFIFSLSFCLQVVDGKSLIVYGLFYIIGLVSLTVLCIYDGFISMIKMFFSFVYVFFFSAPLQQYSSGRIFWNLTYISDKDYIVANCLIILSCGLILSAYKLTKCAAYDKLKKYERPCEISKFTMYIFILIDIFCLAYFVKINGLITFENSSSDTIFTSIQKIIRFFPAATLLICMAANDEIKKKNKFKIGIIAVIVIILFFPLAGAVARFLLFGTYLMILAPYIKKIKVKAILPLTLLVGFNFLFPMFNFFKRNTIREITNMTFVNNAFNTVDFDAYQLFIYSMKYVEVNGILFGKNIITAALFFVPRSIWGGKLQHSGVLVSQFYNADFTNLSCPYVGELYLAFGVIGIVIGSVIIGGLLKKMDYFFNSHSSDKSLFVTVLFGMTIYILRGALLPATAYTMALVISLWIGICILKTTNLKKQS